MALRYSPARPSLLRRAAILLLSLFLPGQVLLAQEDAAFDPIAAGAELDQLGERLAAEGVGTQFLAEARARVVQLDAEAAVCRQQATEERERLQARFEPLEDVDADVAPVVFDQRNEIREQLDEAIARQTQCNTVKDYSEALIARITETQNQLSQQFLSSRGKSFFVSVAEFPDRVRTWPSRIRGSVDLELAPGISPGALFWMLIVAGSIAAMLGLFIRHRFNQWFAAAGGAEAPPQMKYLFPKPLAQYSPLLLEGLALTGVLAAAIQTPNYDLAVMRIATGIFLYGIACVVIDWATGPLSPSARVNGLIPDHVRPLRFRLRLFSLTLVASFAVLGTEWLAIRNVDPEVSGRTTMIFLVALAMLGVLAYIRRIPGVQGRIRLIRYAGATALIVGIFALFIGYQNFAGYIVHGVARTALALAILWILLWLVFTTFEFLTRDDSPGAVQLRSNLGVSKHASRTGLGFMQLVADLIIWISFVVYLIYVWDESGTTLERLVDLVVLGGEVGNIRLVPLNIIGGILVFAALLIAINWMKRWIDRRWLQHIVQGAWRTRGTHDVVRLRRFYRCCPRRSYAGRRGTDRARLGQLGTRPGHRFRHAGDREQLCFRTYPAFRATDSRGRFRDGWRCGRLRAQYQDSRNGNRDTGQPERACTEFRTRFGACYELGTA